MTGTIDSEIDFEQAYFDVRNLMESHEHWIHHLHLTDDYLGDAAQDVHTREKPIWEGFVPEPGVNYCMGPPTDWETVPVTLEERVIGFSECNKSWLATGTVVKLLDDGRPGNIHDPSMFTLLPAAKTVEMHWRRLFLHPDDFHSRHFSIPRTMTAISKKYIKMNKDSSMCYKSGIDPFPNVCPSGPVWEFFAVKLIEKSRVDDLMNFFDLTKKIWFPLHEFRHSKIVEWGEIKPVYAELSNRMDDFLLLLNNLLTPRWADLE